MVSLTCELKDKKPVTRVPGEGAVWRKEHQIREGAPELGSPLPTLSPGG